MTEEQQLIIWSEAMNDGQTVHLYYDASTDLYAAYGLSAYCVSRIIRPLEGYSAELMMPVVQVSRQHLLQLRSHLGHIVECQESRYYRIEMKTRPRTDGYQKWAERARRKCGHC